MLSQGDNDHLGTQGLLLLHERADLFGVIGLEPEEGVVDVAD